MERQEYIDLLEKTETHIELLKKMPKIIGTLINSGKEINSKNVSNNILKPSFYDNQNFSEIVKNNIEKHSNYDTINVFEHFYVRPVLESHLSQQVQR